LEQKDRIHSIGGSDTKDVLSLEPYGCARKLWYKKREYEPEFDTHKPVFDRGHELENIIARKYAKLTGYKVQKKKKALHHPDHKYITANLDRVILGSNKGVGVLECKTMGAFAWRKYQKEGLPDEYITQMQHYLYVTGYRWGAYAILWADGWQFDWFNIERDSELIERIIDAEHVFWRKVEHGEAPERLDASDRRCKSCEYQDTCQGALIMAVANYNAEKSDKLDEADDSVEKLLKEFRENKELYEQANGLLEDTRNKLREALKDKTGVVGSMGRVYYTPVTQNRLDINAIKKDCPEIANKYSKHKTFRSLKVYLNE